MKKLPLLFPVYNTSKYVLVCSKFYASFLSAIRRNELHHYVYLVDKELWDYAHGRTTEINSEWYLDDDGLPFLHLYCTEIINEEAVCHKQDYITDAVGVMQEIDYNEKSNYVAIDATKLGFTLSYDLSKVFLVCHKDNVEKLPTLNEYDMLDVLYAVYKTEWDSADASGKSVDLLAVSISHNEIRFPFSFVSMSIVRTISFGRANEYTEVPVQTCKAVEQLEKWRKEGLL